MNNIIRNRIRCNHCGDIIESRYRHDYVTCKCAAVSVDGGHSYLKRAYKNSEPERDYTELSEFEE